MVSPTTPTVSLGEGDTPLVPLPRLGARIGLPRLRAKLETINPTGSYKDRIAASSIALALQRGHRGWIATSSGNAGAALASYGARAGLPGLLLVMPSIPREKLLPAQAVGTRVVRVDGVGTGGGPDEMARMFAAVSAAAEQHDLFLAVTANALNPQGMLGADAIGAELAREPVVPDVVYVPTGGGGLSVCVARGLAAEGAKTAVVVAQPSGCAPIVGVLDGALDEPRIDRCDSAITGLQLPLPPDGDASVAAVRASGGWGTARPDDAILAAQRDLATLEGVFVEPAAAAGIAAAAHDRATGRIDADAEAVAVLTGAGFKDLATVERWIEPPEACRPVELPERIDDWADGLA